MGWIRVEGKPREVQGYQDGKTIAVLDLQVATAADLPDLGDVVENYIVAAGSTAQIVETDETTFVTLSGDSEEWWPDQSGTRSLAASPNATRTLSEEMETREDPQLSREDLNLEPFPEPIETKKEFIESIEEPEREEREEE